jgi:hypothetical protein
MTTSEQEPAGDPTESVGTGQSAAESAGDESAGGVGPDSPVGDRDEFPGS